MPPIRALPYPRSFMSTTLAPCEAAIVWDPSVLPLSATMTSPRMPVRRRKPCALVRHCPSVSASLRHGIRIESSQESMSVANHEANGVPEGPGYHIRHSLDGLGLKGGIVYFRVCRRPQGT